jgi:molybdopterin-guanine dinucleotide biosynthesis protein A
MGQSKPALEFGGVPLLRRVTERLQQVVPEVIVIGGADLQALVPGIAVLPDRRPGHGPLGGLESALDAAAARHLRSACVVACDMPFLSPSLLDHLVRCAQQPAATEVVLLRSAHGLEFLHAVYGTGCLPAVRAQLATRDGSLHTLIAGLTALEIGPEEAAVFDVSGRSALNVNTPREWAEALRLA